MFKSSSSNLSNFRELVASLSLVVQIQAELSDILDDYDQRLCSLDEDRNRLLVDYRALETRCNSLEKRYSELLYKFSEVKQASK